ncbi:hypothetical protein D0T87_19865 [Bacteroides sp. 51]|nr:hypothetical protein [Bacteroides sp. 51]
MHNTIIPKTKGASPKISEEKTDANDGINTDAKQMDISKYLFKECNCYFYVSYIFVQETL